MHQFTYPPIYSFTHLLISPVHLCTHRGAHRDQALEAQTQGHSRPTFPNDVWKVILIRTFASHPWYQASSRRRSQTTARSKPDTPHRSLVLSPPHTRSLIGASLLSHVFRITISLLCAVRACNHNPLSRPNRHRLVRPATGHPWSASIRSVNQK